MSKDHVAPFSGCSGLCPGSHTREAKPHCRRQGEKAWEVQALNPRGDKHSCHRFTAGKPSMPHLRKQRETARLMCPSSRSERARERERDKKGDRQWDMVREGASTQRDRQPRIVRQTVCHRDRDRGRAKGQHRHTEQQIDGSNSEPPSKRTQRSSEKTLYAKTRTVIPNTKP